jgi:hypothetical protein
MLDFWSEKSQAFSITPVFTVDSKYFLENHAGQVFILEPDLDVSLPRLLQNGTKIYFTMQTLFRVKFFVKTY